MLCPLVFFVEVRVGQAWSALCVSKLVPPWRASVFSGAPAKYSNLPVKTTH